jgi:hypothetical protein
MAWPKAKKAREAKHRARCRMQIHMHVAVKLNLINYLRMARGGTGGLDLVTTRGPKED